MYVRDTLFQGNVNYASLPVSKPFNRRYPNE